MKVSEEEEIDLFSAGGGQAQRRTTRYADVESIFLFV